MIALFLHPVVLCVILYAVSRGGADTEFWRVFLVALGIGVASAGMNHAFGEALGVLTIVPVLAVAVYLLMAYCSVTLKQAIISVAVYFGYLVGFALLMRSLLSTR
jgi:hypothetical protein